MFIVLYLHYYNKLLLTLTTGVIPSLSRKVKSDPCTKN